MLRANSWKFLRTFKECFAISFHFVLRLKVQVEYREILSFEVYFFKSIWDHVCP